MQAGHLNLFCCALSFYAGNAGIYFFMLSFQVIVGFVAMNLFIAVVLASLELSDEGSMFDSVRGSKRTQFTRAWLEFDPSMTGFISLGDLVLLERSEDNPFKHFDPDGLDSGIVTKFAWALSEGDHLCLKLLERLFRLFLFLLLFFIHPPPPASSSSAC